MKKEEKQQLKQILFRSIDEQLEKLSERNRRIGRLQKELGLETLTNQETTTAR